MIYLIISIIFIIVIVYFLTYLHIKNKIEKGKRLSEYENYFRYAESQNKLRANLNQEKEQHGKEVQSEIKELRNAPKNSIGARANALF